MGKELHYWWERAFQLPGIIVGGAHGYAHRLYCMEEPCEHERAGRLYTAWCKLRALQNAIASRSEGAMAAFVLFELDSDALWQRAELRLEAFMRQYVPATDWADSPSIFFGCNLPWNGEDRGRRQWNASLINGERGPPTTGVMLLSSTASTREALRSGGHRPRRHHARAQVCVGAERIVASCGSGGPILRAACASSTTSGVASARGRWIRGIPRPLRTCRAACSRSRGGRRGSTPWD